jgi:hypothetical protein
LSLNIFLEDNPKMALNEASNNNPKAA